MEGRKLIESKKRNVFPLGQVEATHCRLIMSLSKVVPHITEPDWGVKRALDYTAQPLKQTQYVCTSSPLHLEGVC